jgi:hypothetical protein
VKHPLIALVSSVKGLLSRCAPLWFFFYLCLLAFGFLKNQIGGCATAAAVGGIAFCMSNNSKVSLSFAATFRLTMKEATG